jgi:DNA-binding MarR family transcriptional regulator
LPGSVSARNVFRMGTNLRSDSNSSSGGRAVERSLNAIRSIVRALRVNTRAIELKMGISLAQLFVLQQLDEAPADSLNALAERTATHQSSVSVVVRRPVERGYVSRTASAADKRRVEIAVTETGRGLLAEAPLTIQMQLMTAMRTMDDAEQRMLADLLERWLRLARIDFAAPPMLGEEEGSHAEAV